jgi:hypothetical protein
METIREILDLVVIPLFTAGMLLNLYRLQFPSKNTPQKMQKQLDRSFKNFVIFALLSIHLMLFTHY